MLKGCDISNWQRTTPDGYDFYIIKASEGIKYKDVMLDKHYNTIRARGCDLYGFYHYARPDYGNSAEAEADYFLSFVGHHAGKCLFVLDYEGKALNYGPEWALRWCRRVYQKTGVRPLIYLQSSVVYKYGRLLEEDFGLWIASWGVKKPYIKPWPFYALWQYSSKPIDLDYFNGDRSTWFKYCAINKEK